MTVKDGLNAEQVARQEAVKRKVEERRRWAELHRTYERCIDIAEGVWRERLNDAQAVQQDLAVEMRDRYTLVADGNPEMFAPKRADTHIPVPLFTPRDRQQFIKEVATTLLIEANRRNLTVTPELKQPETPAEAASGADEGDAEAASLDSAGTPA